jgi:pyrroloquinoline quinone biosynthesis protein B
VLLNASPDLRQQIAVTSELAPSPEQSLRCSPIAAVVLTSGDVDHIAGLLSLREGLFFTLYATQRVLATLAANSVFNVLDRAHVPRAALALDTVVEVVGGLAVEAFAVPGKVALYLEEERAGLATHAGDSIGLKVTETAARASFFYIPACAALEPDLAARLRGASLVLLDGTLYTDEEMIAQGLSQKTGRRMGHISMSGTDGSMAALAALGIERRVYVHINNSNPVLDAASPERAEVARAGWEVAFDGMEIRL